MPFVHCHLTMLPRLALVDCWSLPGFLQLAMGCTTAALCSGTE